MRTGTYYLNNSGSRWVHYQNGCKELITLQNKAGEMITRVVQFYQSFGNFAIARISYKGKKLNVFPDTILD